MAIQLTEEEARVLAFLRECYPITVEELSSELRIRKDVLQRVLKSLMLKGVLELEPLSDKTYIRLLTPEANLPAKKKDKRPKTGDDPEDFYEALMYQ